MVVNFLCWAIRFSIGSELDVLAYVFKFGVYWIDQGFVVTDAKIRVNDLEYECRMAFVKYSCNITI